MHPLQARKLRRVTMDTTAQLFAKLRVGHWRCRAPQGQHDRSSAERRLGLLKPPSVVAAR